MLEIGKLVSEECRVEPVGGYAIADDTARFGSLLENRDRKPFPCQLGRAGKPGGSGPDDRNFRPGLRGCRKRLEADLPPVLDQGALDFPYFDGPADAGGAALFFAEPRRRAEHAAGAAEDVVALDRADRPGDVVKAKLADEGAGVGLGGTALRAGGIQAEEASVSLGDCLGEVEALCHRLEKRRGAHAGASF